MKCGGINCFYKFFFAVLYYDSVSQIIVWEVANVVRHLFETNFILLVDEFLVCALVVFVDLFTFCFHFENYVL